MKFTSTASALLGAVVIVDASVLPFHLNIFKDRQVRCQPINYTFQTTVPYVNNSQDPTTINYGGFQYRLPSGAKSGELISFLGNFYTGQTESGQITTISSTTSSNDTNASSYSNGTAIASTTEKTIITTAYSQGNASSASAGGAGSGTSTSSSSSGNSNSTATAVSDALGNVNILTNATTADATNSQSIKNFKAAGAASSCAANNEDAATAEATQIDSVQYTTANGATINSDAYAACSAGVVAPSTSSSSGSSSSGSQASVSGVTAMVTCDGVTTTNTQASTSYKVMVVGMYCPANAPQPGFSGAIAGQRIAKSSAQC